MAKFIPANASYVGRIGRKNVFGVVEELFAHLDALF